MKKSHKRTVPCSKYSEVHLTKGEQHFGFRYNYKDAMLEVIKDGVRNKLIPMDYVKSKLESHSVFKIPGLPDSEIRDMYERLFESNQIYEIIRTKDIPLDKPAEFAQRCGKNSVFELSSDSRLQMFNMLSQAVPN